MKRRHAIRSLSAAGVLLVGASACQPDPPARFVYQEPSPPEAVAAGTLLGATGDLALLRVENPGGSPGCEGAVKPDLRAARRGDRPGSTIDPASAVELSAGGNRVFTRPGGHIALINVCEGFVSRIWLGKTTADGITDISVVPDLHPAPPGQLLLTAWSADGRRFLGTEVTGPGLDGRRAVSVDAVTGTVADLGATGFWVGELAGGALVLDQGERVVVDGRAVDVPGGGAGWRYLAISPEGERVAVGTAAGLNVIGRDGSRVEWDDEPVRGLLAWSTDGAAVAYPTGPDDSFRGEMHVDRPGAEPVTVASDTAVYEPLVFTERAGRQVLLYTVPGPDPILPEGRKVAAVTFSADTGAPDNPRAYAAAAFDAWQAGDIDRLTRLTTDPARNVLTARSSRPGDVWRGPVCQGATGDTYCRWTGPHATLSIETRNEPASAGDDHAVVGVSIEPPEGGVALWPSTTREQAGNQQAQVDGGHSPWLLEPASVAEFFARDELGWPVATVRGGAYRDRYTICSPAGGAVDVLLTQPARTGAGGIWTVERLLAVP